MPLTTEDKRFFFLLDFVFSLVHINGSTVRNSICISRLACARVKKETKGVERCMRHGLTACNIHCCYT